MLTDLSTSPEILAELGSRLRQQRLAQGLQQARLAAMAGVSTGAVQILESTGKSSLDTFVRIIHALGLIGELRDLFALPRTSIAQMEKADASTRRQRAPRRKPT